MQRRDRDEVQFGLSRKDVASFLNQALNSEPEYKKCFECNGVCSLSWFCLPYGITVCIDCAGTHRCLGIHISFIRHWTMDLWNMKQLIYVVLGGQARANKEIGFLKSKYQGKDKLESARNFYNSPEVIEFVKKIQKEYETLRRLFEYIHTRHIDLALEMLQNFPKTQKFGGYILRVLLPTIHNFPAVILQFLFKEHMYPQFDSISPLKILCQRNELISAITILESGQNKTHSDFYLEGSQDHFIYRLKFHFCWKAIRLLILGNRDKTNNLHRLTKDTLNHIIFHFLNMFSLDQIN